MNNTGLACFDCTIQAQRFLLVTSIGYVGLQICRHYRPKATESQRSLARRSLARPLEGVLFLLRLPSFPR